jgi:hypothetical protein
MADYPARETEEMNELRRDAIRRAREMQARAMIPPGFGGRPGPEAPSAAEKEEPPAPEESGPERPAQREPEPDGTGAGHGPGIGGALDLLLKDPERTLILALLLILTEEKADSSLIFAMMYLLI